MAANTVSMDLNPSAIALDMVSRMDALAAKGEWDQVETLATRIKHTLMDIPEAERRSVMIGVTQTIERIKTIVLSSRHDVTDKLTEIRRGRMATEAYGYTSGSEATAALR